MTDKIEITPKQIELIKILNSYKNMSWNANSTQELITIGKAIIQKFLKETPADIQFADGSSKPDEKGKKLVLEILENDIISFENGGYTDLKNEKFAIASTIAILMGVFARISVEKMLEIINE